MLVFTWHSATLYITPIQCINGRYHDLSGMKATRVVETFARAETNHIYNPRVFYIR